MRLRFASFAAQAAFFGGRMSVLLFCIFFNGDACRNSLQHVSYLNFLYLDLVILAVAVALILWAKRA